jgi:hypothetical protein
MSFYAFLVFRVSSESSDLILMVCPIRKLAVFSAFEQQHFIEESRTFQTLLLMRLLPDISLIIIPFHENILYLPA